MPQTHIWVAEPPPPSPSRGRHCLPAPFVEVYSHVTHFVACCKECCAHSLPLPCPTNCPARQVHEGERSERRDAGSEACSGLSLTPMEKKWVWVLPNVFPRVLLFICTICNVFDLEFDLPVCMYCMYLRPHFLRVIHDVKFRVMCTCCFVFFGNKFTEPLFMLICSRHGVNKTSTFIQCRLVNMF